MSKNWQDLSIALAGVMQACGLVEQLAKTGYLPSEPYSTSIQSLFVFDPDNALAVYGGEIKHLEHGLALLRDILQQSSRHHRDTLGYSLGVLHLQKKLTGRKDMLQVIGSRLQQAAQQAEHFSPTHDNVLGNLGDLYSSTISTFRFRIQVKGDATYLQQTRIANQVRALLLAAIRATTLWRQLGGNRWQILLQRQKLLAVTEELLRQARVG